MKQASPTLNWDFLEILPTVPLIIVMLQGTKSKKSPAAEPVEQDCKEVQHREPGWGEGRAGGGGGGPPRLPQEGAQWETTKEHQHRYRIFLIF